VHSLLVSIVVSFVSSLLSSPCCDEPFFLADEIRYFRVKAVYERNSVENKPKPGRKKLVTERGDRVILRSVKVNRRETLRDLTNIVNERLPWPVSTRTVRRHQLFPSGFRLIFHGIPLIITL
jgi:hypothetical protein